MNKASILIVEDEAIVAADLAGMLGRLGYEVIGTTGLGEEAISIARDQRPDLVLLDIRLAGAMDGVEAAGIIHREFDLPVIFLTAHSDTTTLERAKLSEPFGYLLKPFEELGLETHIEMALYKHQAELKLRQAYDELELRVEERTRELREAEQELRVVNETLEQRVAERTAELQVANAKLLDSRRASLNMMEDAVAARWQAEKASAELLREAMERKQAEEAMRQSEEQYRTLFNSLIEGFCIIEVLFDADERPIDYRFLVINPAFEAQTGLRNAQGKLMRDLAPEHEAHWFEIYGKVALTGEPTCFENEAKALNRWFNVCAYRIGEQDSHKVAILFSDITEARRAAEELRESRERLALALASSRMATFDWDIVKNKRTWSDGVHSMLGTKPETFSGTAEEFFRIIHPEDRSSVQASLDRAVNTIGVYESEYRAVWPDGSIHHICARGKVHSDDMGRAVLLAGVCWDITEAKLAEDRLRVQARTLKALNSGNHTLLHATDELSLLQAVCRIVAEDCGHAMVWIGFAEDDQEKSIRPVAQAGFEEGYLETLGVTWADTERGRGPTGTAIRTGKPCGCADMLSDPAFEPWRNEALKRGYASSLVLPLMGDNKAFGALSIYSQKTNAFADEEVALLLQLADELAYGIRTVRLRLAHDQAFEDLRLTKEAAEAATRAKSQFLANMSHELRTPMTGVLGMLDLALGTSLDDKAREFICTAHNSARSLLRIINDILDLTKVESGRLSIEEKPFILRECVSGAIEILRSVASRKGLELNHSVTGDLPQKMVGDQVRLRQVLVNLIGNAVKFTEKGKVEVRVTAGAVISGCKRETNFTVSDTGIGIPVDKRYLLFNSFSQIDDSDTRSFGGTGLGLAICKEIVELMGGRISFESTEGKGSTFSFTIPLEEAGSECCAEEEVERTECAPDVPVFQDSASVGSDEGGKPHLLLAEDDAVIRHLLEVMLKKSNFELDIAEDGRKAVEMWEKGAYDLVLMDVQMPYLDGFAATRAIREREQERDMHTIIVAMTAHASTGDEQRCLDAGMDAYVSKPIDLKASIALIRDLIGRRES